MADSVTSGGGLLDPGAAMEHLAAWKGRIDQLAAGTQAMSEQVQQVRVTAADGNGMVEVTVDASGVLVDLWLGQRIARVAPEVVARTIMETIRQARLQVADRAQEIITETLGADSPAGRAIAERVGQRLRDLDPVPDGPDESRRW